MGRKYQGKDFTRITVKLTEEEYKILTDYMRLWYDVRCKADPKTAKQLSISDAVRDAITTLQGYVKLSPTIKSYGDLSATMAESLADVSAKFGQGDTTAQYFDAMAKNTKNISELLYLLSFSLMAEQDGSGDPVFYEMLTGKELNKYNSFRLPEAAKNEI